MRSELRGGSWHLSVPFLPPIALHWSALIGMLLFGRGTLGGALGMLIVIVVHELGHAALVHLRGLRTIGIEVHGMGGVCRYDAARSSALDSSIIAWGGVLAQALLLIPALAFMFHGPPVHGELYFFVHALVLSNALMIALNLAPIEGLDGGRAWSLFEHLRAGRRNRKPSAPPRDRLRAELEAIERRRRARRDDDLLN